MNAYACAFGRALLRCMRDPIDLATRVAFLLVILMVLSALWGTATAAHGGLLGGYTKASLLWYVFAAQLAVFGVRTKMVEEVGEAIGKGGIAVEMLRPVSVVGLRLAVESGECSARLAVAGVAGAILTTVLVGPPPSWGALALAIPAAWIGCMVNLFVQHAFGGLAFWVSDARSAWFLYQKLVFLLGGMLIPLQLLPTALASVCIALPFSAMAYDPGRIASGHFSPTLYLGQVGWGVCALALAVLVFRAGEKRLEVRGG